MGNMLTLIAVARAKWQNVENIWDPKTGLLLT